MERAWCENGAPIPPVAAPEAVEGGRYRLTGAAMTAPSLAVEGVERPPVLAGAHLQRDIHVACVGGHDASHNAIEVLALALELVAVADVEHVAGGAGDGDRWHALDALTRLGGSPTSQRILDPGNPTARADVLAVAGRGARPPQPHGRMTGYGSMSRTGRCGK